METEAINLSKQFLFAPQYLHEEFIGPKSVSDRNRINKENEYVYSDFSQTFQIKQSIVGNEADSNWKILKWMTFSLYSE